MKKQPRKTAWMTKVRYEEALRVAEELGYRKGKVDGAKEEAGKYNERQAIFRSLEDLGQMTRLSRSLFFGCFQENLLFRKPSLHSSR